SDGDSIQLAAHHRFVMHSRTSNDATHVPSCNIRRWVPIVNSSHYGRVRLAGRERLASAGRTIVVIVAGHNGAVSVRTYSQWGTVHSASIAIAGVGPIQTHRSSGSASTGVVRRQREANRRYRKTGYAARYVRSVMHH